MFSVNAWAYRWNHDAVDFCALWGSFWCGIVDGKIRIHTMCPIVRVYPENVFLMNNNRRMCVCSMGILGVRWYRRWLAVAYGVEWVTTTTSTMRTMTMTTLVQSNFEGLQCSEKRYNKRQNNTNFAHCLGGFWLISIEWVEFGLEFNFWLIVSKNKSWFLFLSFFFCLH